MKATCAQSTVSSLTHGERSFSVLWKNTKETHAPLGKAGDAVCTVTFSFSNKKWIRIKLEGGLFVRALYIGNLVDLGVELTTFWPVS